MNSRRWQVVASAFVLSVLIGLVAIDFWVAVALERSSRGEEQVQAARQILDRVYRNGANEVQLKQLLERFHRLAWEILQEDPVPLARPRIAALHRTMLADLLPKHDLSVAAVEPFRRRVVIAFSHDGGLGFSAPYAHAFFRRMISEVTESAHYAWLRNGMSRCLNFAVADDLLSDSVAMNLQLFNGAEGRRALHFSSYPPRLKSSYNERAYLAAVLDLENLPVDFWARSLIRHGVASDVGLAFVPVGSGSMMMSELLTRQPEFATRIAALAAANPLPGTHVDEASGHLILLGQESGAPAVRPVVVYPQEPTVLRLSTLVRPALLVTVLGVFGLWSVRRARLPLGIVLLFVFTLVTALPILTIQTISRFIVAEERRRCEQESMRQLREDLQFLENSTQFRQATLNRIARSLALNPQLAGALDRAAKTSARTATGPGTIAESLIDHVRAQRSWCDRLQGFVMIVGPGEFSQFCNTGTHRQQVDMTDAMLQMLRPAAREGLEVLRERALRQIAPRVVEGPGKAGASARALEQEMVKDFMSRSLGNEIGYNLVHAPFRVQQFKMNLGQVYIVLVPVVVQGVPEYLCLWGWDEAMYYDAMRKMIIDMQRPDNASLYFVSMFSHQPMSTPAGMDSHSILGPRLFELALRARDQAGGDLRETVETASGAMVLAVKDSELSETLLAGTRLLADTSRGLQMLFRQVVAGCFLAAILMAVIAMQLFMRPLQGILGAIERIGPGQYDVVIEDVERRDEFGTLAQAFNAMMVGLREKELLGRYVPESVKLLVADSEVQAKARLGEQRRVTVLFSAVSGPEGHDDIGPDQVFQHMNAHLASMVAAVDEAGGEISKVMGEKIMVVLDHATMGGNEAVADACLRLIGALRRRAQEAGVAVEIGVNTGDVIAGILGSPAVRLDYTVIGDTVNLASRLALLAQTVTGSRVVVSGASRDLLAGRATATRLPIKQVKGKTQAVEVFLLDLA